MTDKYIRHEWYESPQARLLRALRWFDWAEFEDLRVAVDLPTSIEDRQRHDQYYQALLVLVRKGFVEKRFLPRMRAQYRLVAKHRAPFQLEAFA